MRQYPLIRKIANQVNTNFEIYVFGPGQTLTEPWGGGCGLCRARNRKWTLPANRPLAFEPSPNAAHTFKPVGGSVPKGFYRNPLTFRRRFVTVKKWLRLKETSAPMPDAGSLQRNFWSKL